MRGLVQTVCYTYCYMERILFFFIGVGIFVFSATSVQAATLYMDPSSGEVKRGDTLVVSVRLDTDEGECVNTVDAVIHYSENIQPVDTSRGTSILSMWIEEPTIDTQNRTISFAGGIPNGYCGRIAGDPRLTNVVVDLLFRSPGLQIGSTESGKVATINFSDQTRVLLNDGFGTDAPTRLFGAQYTLSDRAGNRLINEWGDIVTSDNVPPEEFSISLQRTPNAFSNRHFIVFNTTDKQSGIDHYEVIEEPLESAFLFDWGANDAPWVRARSPYVLEDQSLNSTIRVKAIDKAGNEYIATLVPEESARGISGNGVLLLALIGAGLCIFLIAAGVFVVLQKRRRREEVSDDYEDEPITDV